MPITLKLNNNELELKIISSPVFNIDREKVNKLPQRRPVWENEEFKHWIFPRNYLNTILARWDQKEIIFDNQLQELIDNLEKQKIPIDELEREEITVKSLDGKILKDYQEKYVSIPKFKNRLICSFEVGCGKTISVLLRAFNLGFNKLIIICPKVLFQASKDWPNAIRNTLGVEPFIYYGSIKQREKLRESFEKPSIILTNYEKLEEILEYFPTARWDQIIIDESHNAATPGTKINKAIDKLIQSNPDAGLQLVTGTPIRNRLRDLWTLTNWISPDLAGSQTSFLDRYEIATKFKEIKKNGRRYRIPIAWRYENQEELFNKLKSVMVRVKIDSYVKWESHEEIVECSMTSKQQRLYDAAKEEILIELQTGQLKINNILTRTLRLLQIGEGLFNLEEDNLESGKLDLIRYEIENSDEKLAIWSVFLPLGKVLQKLYPDQVVLYNGEMSDNLRTLSIYAFRGCFNKEELEDYKRILKYYPDFKFGPGEARILGGINSPKCGIGINLKECNYQILPSFNWLEYANQQVMGRIKRLDSPHENIYTKRLTSENTIEGPALFSILTKWKKSCTIVDGKQDSRTGLSNYEMFKLLRG